MKPDHYYKITVLADIGTLATIENKMLTSEIEVLEEGHRLRELGIDDRIVRVNEFLKDVVVKSYGMEYFCNQAIIQ